MIRRIRGRALMNVVVKLMKVLVLLAGCAGALGFYKPFFDYGTLQVSAHRILTGFTAEEVGLQPDQHVALHDFNQAIQTEEWTTGINVTEHRRSPVPYYFLSAIAFVLVGLVSLIRGRFSGFAALFSLSGALLAVGGWMREVRHTRGMTIDGGTIHLSTGATLLLVSGLVALVASLVVLIKREPDRPKKPPKPPAIDLPEARLISG
jgi:hypothetical protein